MSQDVTGSDRPSSHGAEDGHASEAVPSRVVDEAMLTTIRFQDGLVPVIAQDATTGEVLMLAWADEEALRRSLRTRRMTYWSRSRQDLWVKGETSGNHQHLVEMRLDCDNDAVLALVEQDGVACHTGTATCWTEGTAHGVAGFLGSLDALAAQRMERPQGRYTDSLLADPALAAKKIVEEAHELARVLQGKPNEDTLVHEAADLLYHAIIGVRAAGGRFEDVVRELRARQG